MTHTPTYLWDVAEHLETAEDMAAYLEAALAENDPTLVVAALGDIARAKGMIQMVVETGLGRNHLCQVLSKEGQVELATVLTVVHALGLKLHASVVPVAK